MNDHLAQPRPVVDAANKETRNQRIVAAILGLAVIIPTWLTEFNIVVFTPGQLSSSFTALNLGVAVLLAFMAQETKNTALRVEGEVTPVASPKITVDVPIDTLAALTEMTTNVTNEVSE